MVNFNNFYGIRLVSHRLWSRRSSQTLHTPQCWSSRSPTQVLVRSSLRPPPPVQDDRTQVCPGCTPSLRKAGSCILSFKELKIEVTESLSYFTNPDNLFSDRASTVVMSSYKTTDKALLVRVYLQHPGTLYDVVPRKIPSRK